MYCLQHLIPLSYIRNQTKCYSPETGLKPGFLLLLLLCIRCWYNGVEIRLFILEGSFSTRDPRCWSSVYSREWREEEEDANENISLNGNDLIHACKVKADKSWEVQVSISPTFYEQLFRTKDFRAAFLYLHCRFKLFRRKEFGAKAARKMLVKLTQGVNLQAVFFEKKCFAQLLCAYSLGLV